MDDQSSNSATEQSSTTNNDISWDSKPFAGDAQSGSSDDGISWDSKPFAGDASGGSTLSYIGKSLVKGAGDTVAGVTNLAQRGERLITGQNQPQPGEQWGNAIENVLPNPGQPPNTLLGRLAGSAAEGAGATAPIAAPMALIPGVGWGGAALAETGGALGGLASQGAKELGLGPGWQTGAGLLGSSLVPVGTVARGANIAGRIAGQETPMIVGQTAGKAFKDSAELGVSPVFKSQITGGGPTMGEKFAAGTGAVKEGISDQFSQLQNNAIPKIAGAYAPPEGTAGWFKIPGSDLLNAMTSNDPDKVHATVDAMMQNLAPAGRGSTLSNFVSQLGNLPPPQQATILSNFERQFPGEYRAIFGDPNFSEANRMFANYRGLLNNTVATSALTKGGGGGHDTLTGIVGGLIGEHLLGPYGLALGAAKPVARWINSQRVVSPGLTATYPYLERNPAWRTIAPASVGLSSLGQSSEQ